MVLSFREQYECGRVRSKSVNRETGKSVLMYLSTDLLIYRFTNLPLDNITQHTDGVDCLRWISLPTKKDQAFLPGPF